MRRADTSKPPRPGLVRAQKVILNRGRRFAVTYWRRPPVISAATLAAIDRAVEAFVVDFMRGMRRRAWKQSGAWDVDDVRQEALRVALEAAPSFRRDGGAGKPWYFGTVIWRALSRRVKQWDSPVPLPRSVVRARDLHGPTAEPLPSTADGRELLGGPDDEPNAADRLAAAEARAAIDRALQAIDPLEADVLRLRFGLDDGREQERSLKEVGDACGLTRCRVRHLHDQAINNVRRAMKESP